MKNDLQVLTNVLKTAQMGQVGIRSVMAYAQSENLKKALRSQQKEYDSIEREAYAIASSRGWELTELSPMAKFLSRSSARTSLITGDPDSKIASMMISGNTKGMIKGLKHLNRGTSDASVNTISQKLIDTEYTNIRQMQGYV